MPISEIHLSFFPNVGVVDTLPTTPGASPAPAAHLAPPPARRLRARFAPPTSARNSPRRQEPPEIVWLDSRAAWLFPSTWPAEGDGADEGYYGVIRIIFRSAPERGKSVASTTAEAGGGLGGTQELAAAE